MGHERRDQLRAMQQREQQKARRRRGMLTGAVVLAVLAVVVAVGIAVQVNRSPTSAASGQPPKGTVQRYGVPRGQASAPVTVTMFEDFQCPVCRAVESVIGDTITQYVQQGRIRVVYRPIAFLDEESTTNYSSRALNAAACALNADGDATFVRMHALLYARQPAEGSAGLTDATLVQLAGAAGAKQPQVATCVNQGGFAGWVVAATDRASKEGVTATPTILVNGKHLVFTQQENPVTTLRKAIAGAS